MGAINLAKGKWERFIKPALGRFLPKWTPERMTPCLCAREEGHIWLRHPLGVMSGRDTAEIPGVGRDNWSTGAGRAVAAALRLNAD